MKGSGLLLALLAGMVMISVFYASVVYASLPPDPQAATISSPGNVDVNLATGDMTLSLPVMTVPGREGGMSFPISLSYAADIKLEQSSSIVGLGWGINTAKVERSVVGIPDDYKAGVGGNNIWKHDKNIHPFQYAKKEKRHDWFKAVFEVAKTVATAFAYASVPTDKMTPSNLIYGSHKNYKTDWDKVNWYGIGEGAGSSLMSAINGYTTYHDAIDNIEEGARTDSVSGFYSIGLSDLDGPNPESAIYDINFPDTFVMASPVYSGMLVYGNKNVNPNPKLHVKSASGNLNDVVGGDLCTSNDPEPSQCPDAIAINIENNGPEQTFNRITMLSINGEKYTFEPISFTTTPEVENYVIGTSGLTDFVSYSRSTRFPDFSGACNFGQDNNYFEMQFLKPYPLSFGITSMKSYDYRDMTGDGLTIDDEGSWVKFEYTNYYFTFKTNNTRIGECSINPDGTASYSEVFTQSRYLSKIETPTHAAHFIYADDRTDIKEADGGSSPGGAPPRLVSVKLTKRTGDPNNQNDVLQEVRFIYDYSLGGLPSQQNSPVPPHLTLKNIEYYGVGGYNGGEQNRLPSIDLEYANGASRGTGDNPYYCKNCFDRWGYYYADGSTLEHNDKGDDAGLKSYAWSLTGITWPSGGTTQITYENNMYKRVGKWYANSAPDKGIEQQDTHYGGGVRARNVTNCDGIVSCYTTRYLYNENDLDFSEADGHNSPGAYSESSGVATIEPGSYDGYVDVIDTGNTYTGGGVLYWKTTVVPNPSGNSAPYGYRVIEHTTAKDYSDEGYYIPPVYFEDNGGLNHKYGFSFRRSKSITGVPNSAHFAVIPTGPNNKFLVIGEKGATLRFIYGMRRVVLPGVAYYCYDDITIPNDQNDCNLESDLLGCVTFSADSCTIKHAAGSNLWDAYDNFCDPSDGEARNCGVVYDLNYQSSYENNPNTGGGPVFRFVHGVYDDALCSDEEGHVCDIPSNNLLYGVAGLNCMDADPADSICDIKQLPDGARNISYVDKSYARALPTRDRIFSTAGTVIQETVYTYYDQNGDGRIDYRENGVNPITDKHIKPAWVTLEEVQATFDGKAVNEEYNYNNFNGLLSSKTITNSDSAQSIQLTTYNYEDDGEAMQNHYWDNVKRSVIRQNTNSQLTVKSLREIQWNKLYPGPRWRPWRIYELNENDDWIGIEARCDSQTFDCDKTAEFDYDEWGRTIQAKNYIVSSFVRSGADFGNDLPDAKYTITKAYYGNDNSCNGAGNQHDHAYATCIENCQDAACSNPLDITTKFSYDKLGNVLTSTNTNERTTTFAYDNLWRLDTATPPGESAWTVNYDYYYARDNGGISATNPNRVATTSVLDRSPLIEQKTASYFDGFGRGIQSAIASGSTTNRTNTHYNSRGLPETATDVFQSSVVWPNYDSAEPQNVYKSWSFYYNDPLGRIEKTYPLGSDPNGNSNFERVYPDDTGHEGYSSDATYDSTCVYGPVILPDAPEGENYRKFICSAAQDVKGTVKIRVGEKTGTVVSACIFDGSGNIGGTDAAHRKITYVRLPDISGNRDYYIETCKQNDATGNVIGELGSSYQGQTTYLERYKPPQPHSVINYGGDDDYSFTRGIDKNGVSVVSHTDKLGRVVETDANNLVVNPGFELSTSAENSFWNGCTGVGEDCIQTGAQYNGIQGKYFKAYKLAWNTYQSDIPLKPNKAYIVSFYTKQGSGTVMARLKIVFDDNDYYYNPADGGEYFNCQGSTVYAQWTRVSCMFFTHENTQKITTLYAVTGSGAGEPDFTKYNYIDNIQIEPATPDGSATTLSQVLNEYDVAGRLLKTTMPNGQDIVYTYDTRGMIQTISHPDTDGLKDNDYDAAGNVIRATDPRGKVVGYDYDALNRLWGIDLDNSDEAPENEEIVYHYDDYTGIASCSLENTANGKGRLTAVEGNYLSDNHETVYYKYCYGYDEKSRLIEEKQYIGPVGPGQETYYITYTYNTAGSIKTITYPTDEVVEYAYNQKGQLTGATIPSGTVSYQYNPDSTLRLLSYPNGIATTYQYNPRKWVTEIRIGDFAGENPLFNHWKEQNVYDFAGNIIGIKDPVTYADSGFMYDNLYRLTGAYDAMSRFYRDLSYTYDTNGNRLTENSDYYQYSAEKKDRLTFKDPGPNSHFISYYYDANGNVVQETGGKELKFCSSTQDPLTAGSSPGDYWLLGVDAPVGTPVNIIYDNGTVRYEWNNLQVQYLQNTDRGCFVDTVSPEPRTGVQLTGTGNYKPSSTAWYDGNYIDNHFRIYPASGNYFTTDYYYDNENKLIQINNGGTCSKFIYDASGSRIEKLEPQKFDLTYDAMSSQLGAAGSIVQSIAIQPSGNNLFVLAKNPNALYKCASPKTTMSCASMNLQGFTWNSPQAIAVDPTSENTLYITDSTNMKIYKVSVNANNAQVVYTFTFGEGQTNPTAQPYGTAVDSNGKVFVATKRTHPQNAITIYKLGWNGNALVKEAEHSTPSGDMPSFLGISVGAAKTAAGERDKVYFTSYNRNGVIVYDNSLNPVWYSGTFTYPADADPDVYGYIYVAEASGGGNRIAKSDPQGKSIMEYATKYGPSGEYTFNSVMAVETITDQNGDYVFVADSGNRRIVRFKEAEKWQKTRYIRANGNVIQEDTYVMSGVDCSPPQGGQFLPPQQPSKPSGATGSFDLTKLGRALGKFVFDFFNTPVLANP